MQAVRATRGAAQRGEHIFHEMGARKKIFATSRRANRWAIHGEKRIPASRKFAFDGGPIFAPFDSNASGRKIGVSGEVHRSQTERLSQASAPLCRRRGHGSDAPI
jgi:hypothetical protein